MTVIGTLIASAETSLVKRIDDLTQQVNARDKEFNVKKEPSSIERDLHRVENQSLLGQIRTNQIIVMVLDAIKGIFENGNKELRTTNLHDDKQSGRCTGSVVDKARAAGL